MNFRELNDPLKLIRFLWPHVSLYNKEREMVMAVREARQTYVVAGNQLGGGPRS